MKKELTHVFAKHLQPGDKFNYTGNPIWREVVEIEFRETDDGGRMVIKYLHPHNPDTKPMICSPERDFILKDDDL